MVSNILGHSVKRQIDDSVEGQVQELRFNTCIHRSNIVNTGIESYYTGHGEGEITRNAFTYDICEALAYLVCVLNEREHYQI